MVGGSKSSNSTTSPHQKNNQKTPAKSHVKPQDTHPQQNKQDKFAD
jgi:hypothetical protein